MTGTVNADHGLQQAVGAYAEAVRQQLADLPRDQVDDLTDGIEADLLDALSDVSVASGDADPAVRFGAPAEYARELRVAAGLPGPGETRRARPWPAALEAGARRARRLATTVRRQPWAASVIRLASDVRPLWWVGRAWIVYQAAMWVSIETDWSIPLILPERDGVPSLLRHWALFGVLVVVSVQWGRGRWGAGQLLRISRVLTVIALVLLVPVGVFTYESRYYGSVAGTQVIEVPVDRVVEPDDGVWVGGMQVSNLFVYDAQGDPLTDVQIYDDRGRPVRTTVDQGWSPWSLPGVSETWNFVPARDQDGRDRWNVYPLRGAPTEDFDWDATADEEAPVPPAVRDLLRTEVRLPPLPFAQAPALADAVPTADPTGGQG